MVPGSAATRGGAQPSAVSDSATASLVNRDADNTVSLNDAIQHVATGAKLPEDGVATVQIRLRRVRDEELAAPGIRAGERHPKCTPVIAMTVHLVPNGMAGPAVPISAWIAALHHEVRHDAM